MIEELEGMTSLKDRYMKEMSDLNNGRGLSRTMFSDEIDDAKRSLNLAIESLNKDIQDLKIEIDKLKDEEAV